MKNYSTLLLVLTFSFYANWAFSQWQWVHPFPTGSTLHTTFITPGLKTICGGDGGNIIIKPTSGSEWALIPTGTDQNLFSVDFYDDNTGCAVGGLGKVIYSQDGGSTWNIANLNIQDTLRSVAYTGPSTIIVVGDNGVIIKSINGGNYWSVINSGTTKNLISVKSISSNTLIVAGDAGIILRSTNNGDTWSPVVSGTSSNLHCISFPDQLTGYICGSNETIIKSIDGGLTWSLSSFPYPFNAIFFINPQTGYGVGNHRILKTSNGAQSWNVQFTGDYLFSVCFNDVNNGYAVGTLGTILKTEDGGANWNYENTSYFMDQINGVSFYGQEDTGFIATNDGIWKSTDVGSTWIKKRSGWYSALSFLNSTTGYALGSMIGAPCEIHKTIDGGESWDNELFLNDITDLYSISSPSENVAFAVGMYYALAPFTYYRIYKTGNGGVTWNMIKQGPDSTGLYGCDFVDNNIGYAVGGYTLALSGIWSDGRILKTTDGGTTWTTQKQGLSTVLFAVDAISANTCFAVGDSGVIYRTKDGGSTWSVTVTDSNNYLDAVFFLDENTGYIAGNNGLIMKTMDGGNSWTRQLSGTCKPLNGISMINPTEGFVVGNEGTVLHTRNGGAPVGENELNNQRSIILFPNPSDDYVNVNILTGDSQSPYSISLTGLDGKTVFRTTKYSPEFKLDIQSLTPGMYFLKISSTKTLFVEKLIKE